VVGRQRGAEKPVELEPLDGTSPAPPRLAGRQPGELTQNGRAITRISRPEPWSKVRYRPVYPMMNKPRRFGDRSDRTGASGRIQIRNDALFSTAPCATSARKDVYWGEMAGIRRDPGRRVPMRCATRSFDLPNQPQQQAQCSMRRDVCVH